ncbi:hypothetical protein FRC08_008847 [Ceratobasidium sp. 394]|nr:hypothetical protein FRC08_008847 [Ceratobasidium sp. 394]
MNFSHLPLTFIDQPTGIISLAHNQTVAGATAILGAALLWYLLASDKSGIKTVRGWPYIGHWVFFTRRHDFILENFDKLPDEPMFGFNILKHRVVALKGEEARKAFFERRDLSFSEGYRLLFGAVPDVRDVVDDVPELGEKEKMPWLAKRLLPLFRLDRLASATPQFMADIERNMIKWGDQGKFDPFEDMYSIVFQLTIRAAACREIADSVDSCKRLEKLYWACEKGTTPAAVLFPWLPSGPRKQRIAATTEIYTWFDSIIRARRAEGRREEDTMQALMDMGDSTAEIIRFVMGVLFVGIVNTGLMSAWILIFLDQEPEWRDKAVEELRGLLNKYAPTSKAYSSATERLSLVPPEALEDELPILEDCLRETIRLIFTATLLRRVIKGDLDLYGRTIPQGSFLAYQADETHGNPDIYPEPSRFNPGRYAEGQDKSQAHAFLGWGVGRHPCVGKKFAQFEIKAMLLMFLSSYEYEIVNSKGLKPDPSMTVPDKNDLHQARPKGDVFYVKYTKREKWL